VAVASAVELSCTKSTLAGCEVETMAEDE